MNSLKYLSLPVFIVSLITGLLYIYFIENDAKIVYVYPSPENCGKTQYEDNAGNCFMYEHFLFHFKVSTAASTTSTLTIQNVEESKPTTTNEQIDKIGQKLEELSIVAAESRTTSESVDNKSDVVASVDSVADQKLSDVVAAAPTTVAAQPSAALPLPKIHSENQLNNNLKKSDAVTPNVAAETSRVTPPAASLDFEPVSPTPLPPDTPKSTNDDFIEGKKIISAKK